MQLTRTHLGWLAAVGVVAAIAALALRPKSLDVDGGVVARGALRVTIDGDARTRVRHRFAVTAPVAGRLERITVDVGDSAVAGRIVARIAPVPLDAQSAAAARARLAGAEASLREAEARVVETRLTADDAARTLARFRAVESIGGLAPAQRERAEVAARVGADALAAALVRREATTREVQAARASLAGVGTTPSIPVVAVRAPTTGRILRIAEPSERIVAAGTPIVELGDPCDLEVVVDLLSTDAVRVVPGMAVDLVAWGGDAPLRGRVRQVEPSAVTRVSALGVDEQRVNVIVDVLDAPPALGDGFRLDAKIVVWEGARVLTVPASGVFHTGDGWSAFAIANGRAALRHVRVGHQSDAAVELLDGLAEGERVVLFPSDRLRNGLRVRAR